MFSTVPTSTSRYLILVFPASRPSAVSNVMRTAGPSLAQVLQVSQPAMTAATSGMSQISESPRARRTGAAGGGGGGSEGGRARVARSCIAGVPDQPRIEGHRGQHGDDHDRREGDRPPPGLDRGEVAEAHEG